MPNQYKSFYRADIIAKVREVALYAMCVPETDEDEDFHRMVASVAFYNYGIQDFAKALISAFECMGDDE